MSSSAAESQAASFPDGVFLPMQESQATPADSHATPADSHVQRGESHRRQLRSHPYQVVPAWDDDDKRRIQAKRTHVIEMIKRCPMYKLAQDPAVSPAGSAPRTPDPTDMSVPKREWEKSMVAWRSGLEEIANRVWGPLDTE